MRDFTKLINLFHANLSFPLHCPDASGGVRHLGEKSDECNQWKHHCEAADKMLSSKVCATGQCSSGICRGLHICPL